MDTVLIGYLGVLALFVLLALGVHVGIALTVIGFVGVWLIQGSIMAGLGLMHVSAFYKIVHYSLTCLPLFILMGYFALHAGISTEVFSAASKWVGRLPGGLAIATVMGNAAFGAVTGSSIVATTVFTKVSYPEMMRFNYDKKFACGTVVGGAMLGMLIPPSILMVLYGIITEQSIAHLLMAGIGPGLLLASMFSILCFFMAFFNPKLAPMPPQAVTFKEKIVSLKGTWGIIAVAGLLLGGLYTGLFSPTEAGAVGAFGVFVVAMVKRQLNWSKITEAVVEAVRVNAAIFLVLVGATIFSRFIGLSTITSELTKWVAAAGMPVMAMIAIFMVLYLVLGCLLDSMSMMLITLPILDPLITGMGLDRIWFAMCVIMAIECGLLTPPFGLNIYAMKAVLGDEVELMDIFKGAFPFFLVSLAALVIIMYVKPISVFLPRTMFTTR
ncbi:TRAP transporter large permease [Chloroflexota bacterium]